MEEEEDPSSKRPHIQSDEILSFQIKSDEINPRIENVFLRSFFSSSLSAGTGINIEDADALKLRVAELQCVELVHLIESVPYVLTQPF